MSSYFKQWHQQQTPSKRTRSEGPVYRTSCPTFESVAASALSDIRRKNSQTYSRLSEPEIQNILGAIRRRSDAHESMSKPATNWRYSRPPPPKEKPPKLPKRQAGDPLSPDYQRTPFGFASRSRSREKHDAAPVPPPRRRFRDVERSASESLTRRHSGLAEAQSRRSKTEEEIAAILQSHQSKRRNSGSSFSASPRRLNQPDEESIKWNLNPAYVASPDAMMESEFAFGKKDDSECEMEEPVLEEILNSGAGKPSKDEPVLKQEENSNFCAGNGEETRLSSPDWNVNPAYDSKPFTPVQNTMNSDMEATVRDIKQRLEEMSEDLDKLKSQATQLQDNIENELTDEEDTTEWSGYCSATVPIPREQNEADLIVKRRPPLVIKRPESLYHDGISNNGIALR